MGFRRYYLNISIRVILLTATCFVLTILLSDSGLWLAKINVLILVVVQVFLLGKYHRRFHLDLEFILNSWKSKDFSLHLKERTETKEFPELYNSLDEINTRLKQVEKQNVGEGLLFQFITNHVRVGIIAADHQDNIMLVNNAVLEMFNLKEAPKSLIDLEKRLVDTLLDLSLGESKMMHMDSGGVVKNIMVRTGKFMLEEQEVTLITLDDIHAELQKNEVETWQNLIGVLAHEIMNSVAPINALSHKLVTYLAKDTIDSKTLTKASDSAEIVQRRSKGLMRFVEDYRKMSGVPLPNKHTLTISELFKDVETLFIADHQDIDLEVSLVTGLEIQADKAQLAQVLLNLLLNAFYATAETPQPQIILKGWEDTMRNYIAVTDNGIGMDKEVIEKIFVPFFSTRANGSGIGLSLSKQIMSLHGGRINVESIVGKGTTMTLTFSKG
jgi:signal transduction histidine kinase